MTSKINGLSVLGLTFAAALALIAFSAAAAHAAKWLVLDAEITQNHTFTGTGELGTLLIAAWGVEIHCASSAVSGTLLSAGAKDVGHASVSFSGCSLKTMGGSLTTHATCNVEVLPATGTALAVDGDTVLMSTTGGVFTQFHFTNKIGPKDPCPLEPLYNIGGTLRALVENNNTNLPILNPSIAQGDDLLHAPLAATIDGGKVTIKITTAGDEKVDWGVC